EDVAGLENEKQEWLESPPGQRLIRRIIQHIAIIKYLNMQPEAKELEGLEGKIQDYRENLMITRMVEDLSKVTPFISQEEMMEYYIKYPEEFYQEPKRLARHIMIYKEDTDPNNPFQTSPEQIRSALENGEDFGKLLLKSQSDSANNDGLLGWLPKGVLAQEFERELWAMEVGEIRGPIEIGETVHFIHLLDEKPGGLRAFSECRETIRTLLQDEKRIVYRFKFLGLPEELSLSLDPQNTKQYQDALLKAAYARDWHKNMEVVNKTDAYAKYKIAELLFKNRIDRLRQKRHLPREMETTWLIESEAAKQLLETSHFRFLIKLDTVQPKSTPEIPSE
ncbi:hypothetical protein GF373_12000, partial [bacterium]|nr:hypothetical protein [bacterium]